MRTATGGRAYGAALSLVIRALMALIMLYAREYEVSCVDGRQGKLAFISFDHFMFESLEFGGAVNIVPLGQQRYFELDLACTFKGFCQHSLARPCYLLEETAMKLLDTYKVI